MNFVSKDQNLKVCDRLYEDALKRKKLKSLKLKEVVNSSVFDIKKKKGK